MPQPDYEGFVKELTALSRKYGLAVDDDELVPALVGFYALSTIPGQWGGTRYLIEWKES